MSESTLVSLAMGVTDRTCLDAETTGVKVTCWPAGTDLR